MDRCIVGHEETKKGILLALVAREHVYIEGPPGTAKTMLAEVPHPVRLPTAPVVVMNRVPSSL